jgi:hypothetical protein
VKELRGSIAAQNKVNKVSAHKKQKNFQTLKAKQGQKTGSHSGHGNKEKKRIQYFFLCLET